MPEPYAKFLKRADDLAPDARAQLDDRFQQITKILNRRGVFAGTAHRRVTIPKTTLTEDDVKHLGFEPVVIAIPEAGQDRFMSWRHPEHTYHIHSHDDRWTLHKDRHPAATMLARSQGKFKSFVEGIPHVVTEGIPGLAYYLKGQVMGRGSTADEVDKSLRPETKRLLGELGPSPTLKAAAESLHLRFPAPRRGSPFLKVADVTTELQPHQERVVERMSDPNQRGLIVAHGLGSGKTLTAIATADRLGLPADVVVPAALRANFEKEIDKHTDAPPPVNIQSVQNVARKGGGLTNPLLIVDEAHRARNPTKTQQALMTSPALKRLLLTGSLFYNTPSDVAGPVNLVAGRHTLPANKADFDRFFLRERVNHTSLWDRLRGKDPESVVELNPATKPYLKQVLQKYVDYYPGAKDHFPDQTEQVVKVPMSRDQRDVYNTVMDQAPAWVRERVRNGMPPSKQEASQLNAFLSAARQASNTTAPFRTKQPAASPKILKAVEELKLMLEKDPRAKALIYSNYLDAGVKPYKQQLEALKVPHGEFTGEMPKAQRDQLVRDYNDDKLKALLLSSAGGEGLDLKGTKLIQLLEPHWNEEKLKQVIGRGVRYQSHDHLPEEERKVHVQRYLSVHPKRGLLQRAFTADPGRSVDEYLQAMADRKERLNQQFRELMKTSAYTCGVEKVAFRPLPQGTYPSPQAPMPAPDTAEPTQPPEPQKSKSWLPALAVGGLAGLGAYKYMRTPQLSTNPAFARIQQRANQKGFRRVVDVTHSKDVPTGESFGGWVNRKLSPMADEQGQLNRWNKFKLWAREGPNALPVANVQHKDGLKAVIPGQKGPINLPKDSIVYGRNYGPQSGTRLIRGGTDLEGPVGTQTAVTNLAHKGKGSEAELLMRYAPDSMPLSDTKLERHLPLTMARKTPEQRLAAIKAYQEALKAKLGPQGYDDFVLKPNHGLASSGKFPRAEQDWGAMLQKYDAHVADPANRKSLRSMARTGDNDLANYLKHYGLYEGHVLDRFLKRPDSAYAQKWLPGAQGEFRVHTFGGAAPTELIGARHPEKFLDGMGADKDAIRQFVEKDLLAKLPAKYRKGAYGLDVMPFKDANGNVTYKVMEMNPFERGDFNNPGGASGLLDSSVMPWAGPRFDRAVTGRHTPAVAGLAGLGAGLGAGGLARALTPEREEAAA